MRSPTQASIKSTTPLALEMKCISSSDNSNEYIGSKNAFLDSMSHDYASPEELREQLDGLKKQNLLYEPLPKRSRNFGKEEKHCHVANDRTFKFLLVVVLLLSLGAFILSVMSSFGYINRCSCTQGNEILRSYFKVQNSHENEVTPGRYILNNHLPKVNNRKRCEICSKLAMNTPVLRRTSVFIVNFHLIS